MKSYFKGGRFSADVPDADEVEEAVKAFMNLIG